MTKPRPIVQFVDAPEPDATVLFDANTEDVFADVATLAEGFSLGAPTLEGDPRSRGRQWNLRRLSLPLSVAGERAAAVAKHHQLARVVARGGWLRFQLDEFADPSWFRFYPTAQDPADFALVIGERARPDRWRFTIALDAEPTGVGEEIVLGPYTVGNNPTTGMTVALPEIVGDLPAPAAVKMVRAGGKVLGPAVGVAPVAPGVFTASIWTAAVGAQVTDAEMVAGWYRPTTAVVADEWTSVATWTPSGLRVGRWRMLLRVDGGHAGTFAARWLVSSSGSQVATAPVTIPSDDQIRWVDTGQAPWPLRDASALGVTAASQVTLQLRRLEAGSELRLDNVLMMVPVGEDSTLLGLTIDDPGTATATVRVDADERAAVAAAGSAVQRPPGVRGGWPALTPGEDNVLAVWQNLDPTRVRGIDDAHASSAQVTVSYRPQLMWGVA